MRKKFEQYYQDGNVVDGYEKQRSASKNRVDYRNKEVNTILSLLSHDKKQKILEIGCGTGFLTRQLKERGDLTATDNSPNMLKNVKGKIKQGVIFKQVNLFEIPFEGASFDTVVSLRVYSHLDKKEILDAFLEAARVLRSGGNFIFDFEGRSILRRIIEEIYTLLKGKQGTETYQYPIKDIKGLSEKFNFEIVKVVKIKHRIGHQLFIKLMKK